MPTGYTYVFEKRSDVTLSEFAWRCARAMTALILLRDEPEDAPIPDKFVPSDFYEKRLTEAKLSLAEAKGWTPEEADRRAAEAHAREVERAAAYRAEKGALRARYEAMLAEVSAWQPPATHAGLKAFMREQLETSLKYDCADVYDEPKRLSGEAYRADVVADAERTIARATTSRADELARADERNAWVRALRESVGEPPARKAGR